MKIIGVIPARFGSTRFPGKPLALLGGKPIVQWVIEGAKKLKKFMKAELTEKLRQKGILTSGTFKKKRKYTFKTVSQQRKKSKKMYY